MLSIASARSASISPSAGTKGRRAMCRVSSVSLSSWLKYTRRHSGALLSSKLVFLCRSKRSLKRSISVAISPFFAKGFFSARSCPFSYIRLCPEKTMSCVDSPCPAFAYT